MFKRTIFNSLVILICISLLLSACSSPNQSAATKERDSASPAPALANPAAVYCEGLGYKSVLIEPSEDGSAQDSQCVFPDGSQCGQWDFLAGRCGKANSFCEKNGGSLQEKPDSNIGVCTYPDNSSCLELDYFQGTCKPGQK